MVINITRLDCPARGTFENVDRVWGKLVEKGFVQFECRQIYILDPDGLRIIAQAINHGKPTKVVG